MRMTVQVTSYFHTNSFAQRLVCHRGKSKLGIGLFHELLREPLILDLEIKITLQHYKDVIIVNYSFNIIAIIHCPYFYYRPDKHLINLCFVGVGGYDIFIFNV